MVLDPCYAPGYRNFDVCFLFCCALKSSCLGRLSAIKVQLELELLSSGGLFPSYGTELIPLLPYLRAGLSKKGGGGGNVSIAPGNRSLLSDYGLIRVS